MPTRNPVTVEMVAKWREKFYSIANDLNEHTCIGTLISFIIILYETIIATMSFKYSPGKIASYVDVSRHLPCRDNARMLVVIRDGLTHELYNITDIVEFVLTGCDKFGKENFDYLSHECFNDEIDVCDTIVHACNKILSKPRSIIF